MCWVRNEETLNNDSSCDNTLARQAYHKIQGQLYMGMENPWIDGHQTGTKVLREQPNDILPARKPI
jgi:hypothetical protein